MWLIEKARQFIEYVNSESDQETEAFIDKEYKWILVLACMYLKFDKQHLARTCFQYLFYITVCLCHLVALGMAMPVAFKSNFVLCSKTAYVIILYLVSIMVIIIVLLNRVNIARYHRHMAKGFYDYQERNEEIVEKFKKEMLWERLIIGVIPVSATSVAAGCVFVMCPIGDKYGTFVPANDSSYINIGLPFPAMAYPFSTSNTLGYYSALISQIASGSMLPCIIGGGAYFFVVMAGHMTLQLKILLHSLDHIETRAANYYYKTFGQVIEKNSQAKFADKRYAFCFEKCLNQNFKHHQIILNSFDDLKSICSIPLFASYATGTSVIALSLLSNNVTELPGTTISSMFLSVVEVGIMGLFSWMGQQVTNLGSDIHEKVYGIRWYYSNERVNRSLRIFQTMSMKQMSITCAGIMPCNFETFAKVINTAYSYYNLVNAVQT